MIKTFFGVNIAVRNLDEAASRFESLFGVIPERAKAEYFAFPGLEGVSFDLQGVKINLVSPLDDHNPVAKFLSTKGEGVLLISILSDDLEKDTVALAAKDINFISPMPFKGKFGRVNFVHPQAMHGVQVEVIEPSAQILGQVS